MTKIVPMSALLIALAAVAQVASINHIRLIPSEIAAKQSTGASAGTSGVVGIQTTILSGDPTKPGLYTIRLSVPANTQIQAHTHRDNRSATEAATKPLPSGSFYTEPAGVAHFALTKAEPVVVYITGVGPTDTVYVSTANDPRGN
jgi:hypothetical protein